MNEAHQGLLDEFVDRLWLEEGLARNTLESYRNDLSQFTDWLEKRGSDLIAVTRTDLEGYLAYKNPHSKPRSIGRLIASLRRFYRYLLRENLVSEDPTLQLDSPKLPRSLPKSLTEEEVESLLNQPDEDEMLGLRDR
ncbi:MAG TPA: site-specific integrase, partial [Methylophilaceae bacterium]